MGAPHTRQAVSCQAMVRREPSSRWAAMSLSVQRRSMASKPNWARESRSLPLGTYCNTGIFLGGIRSGAARRGTGGALTNAIPQILRDGVKQMQMLERRGSPFGNWNALKSGNYSLRLRAEQRDARWHSAVYVGERAGISSRMGGEETGRSFRCTARAADRLLRVILCLRGGDLFKGKSKLASCCSQTKKLLVLNH